MSRKMLAVAALALLAPVAIAQAQLSFGVAAGASMPSGDLKTGVETGYHVMATAGIHPPLAPVGFRVDGMFNEFNEKSPSTDKGRILALTANAVFSMPGAIVLSPYLIGGAGMYKMSNSAAGSTSSSDLGVNIGAGIKFGLAGFGAFGEVRFHHIMAEEILGVTPKNRFIPISFGITF
jgi:hypothetical protein